MKYGVIYDNIVYIPSDWGSYYRDEGNKVLLSFDTEEELQNWIKKNSDKEFEVIKYESFSVELSVKVEEIIGSVV